MVLLAGTAHSLSPVTAAVFVDSALTAGNSVAATTLGPVTDLTRTPGSGTEQILTWTLPDGASGARVYRSTDGGSTWALAATVGAPSATWTDTTPAGVTNYSVVAYLGGWTSGRAGGSGGPVVSAPVVLNVADDFHQASGAEMGTALTGGQAWQSMNGLLSLWTRNGTTAVSGYASTSTAASSNPMLLLNAGTGDVAVTEAVHSVGDAIYFRVGDVSNWWRLRADATSSTSSTTIYTYSICSAAGGCTSSSGGAGACPSFLAGGYYTSCSSTGSYVSTSTTYTYYLRLDREESGALTPLATINLGGSLPAYIKVNAKGPAITASYGSTSAAVTEGATVTDNFNATATLHGVGYAAPSSGSVTGVGAVTMVNAS